MSEELHIDRVDLYNDWVAIARKRLTTAGFNVSSLETAKDVSLEYFNTILHLTIPVQPRCIHKTHSFLCPEVLKNGLTEFENKVTRGDSLRPHMSRGTKKVSNRDGLRYDWGIHHFHLGTEIESDGFVKRTGPVLFALVKEADMYFLDVMPHGAWTQQQVLKLIHDNWPQLLEPYRLDIKGLTHELTNDEIAKARKGHILSALKVTEDVFIVPPGGGMVTSGHSMDVVRSHMNNHRHLLAMIESIQSLTDEFICSAKEQGAIRIPKLSFTLVDYDGDKQYALQEGNNGLHRILTGPPGIPSL